MATAQRTYLEMREPRRAAPGADSTTPAMRIDRSSLCTPALWRFLYAEVGRQYHWVDRLWPGPMTRSPRIWTDPACRIWLLTVRGTPAGYFELRRDDDEAIEIAYFGLLRSSSRAAASARTC